MSYTQFQISEARLLYTTPFDPVSLEPSEFYTISAKIKNIGKYAGAEVVQVYVGVPHSKVERPEKLLLGFKKVYLQPNEEKEIEITVFSKDITYYNAQAKNWEYYDPKEIEFFMGNSSRDEIMMKEF